MMVVAAEAAMTTGSQTLSRGLRILELLSEADEPLSIDRTAGLLGVHRSNAYRLVRSLEAHGLVTRDRAGLLLLGPRLAALAAGVARPLQSQALPELTSAANDLQMTCFVCVYDREECVTLASVEPRHAVATVAQRPGSRHFVGVGAPGRAVLSQLPPGQWPRGIAPEVAAQVLNSAGPAVFVSADEVIPTLRSVAVPLRIRGYEPAALGAVYVASEHPDEQIGERLLVAATAVVEALGG